MERTAASTRRRLSAAFATSDGGNEFAIVLRMAFVASERVAAFDAVVMGGGVTRDGRRPTNACCRGRPLAHSCCIVQPSIGIQEKEATIVKARRPRRNEGGSDAWSNTFAVVWVLLRSSG